MNKIIYFFSFLIISVLFSTSCMEDNIRMQGDGNLLFTGEVVESSETSTRGPEANPISRNDYDLVFYVSLKSEENRKCRTYLIPKPNGDGFLRSYQNQDSLLWQSTQNDHYFYGWTMPWIDESESERDINKDNLEDGTRISFDVNDDMYTRNGTSASNYHASLEKFIGAGKGPVNYNNNGEYINFQFRHLVSKIVISTFRYSYVDKDGNYQTPSVEGSITFIGLPAEGVFIREGEYGPIVKPNPDSKQVTYSVKSGTVLYVCPNIDLSKVSYRISSQSKEIESAGDFLGDFSNIYLLRDLNDNWVITQMNEHPGTEPTTTLYAGETLELNIMLRQTIGNYVAAGIRSWDTQDVRETGAYPYLGIYNENEMKNFYDLFQDGYNEDDEERMFQTYGDKETREYRLYNDVSGVNHGFRMGKKYILNGMGHTVEFVPNSSGEIKISKAKDIYLSDGKGNVVYIDEEFNVFKINEDGSRTYIDNLENSKFNGAAGYGINLEAGTIRGTSTP